MSVSTVTWAALPFGYNFIVVMSGALLLGLGAGAIGAFSLLRRQSLVSDAISHATLPGIALGFLVALFLFGDGRVMVLLLAGAVTTGALGTYAVQWITTCTRLREDAAIGTVLSVFFGVGVVLMSHIQTLPGGSQAGLDSFLLGSTATMTAGEAGIIGTAAAAAIVIIVLFFKEFAAVVFDRGHAGNIGLPVARLEALMSTLLLAIVAVGLKTVGIVLIIALVIIPPVTARFWTERLNLMVTLSALFGALACVAGCVVSALVPDTPTGAVIVLALGINFVAALLFAPHRGMIGHLLRAYSFRRRVAMRQGLIDLFRGNPLDLRARQLLLRTGVLEPDGRISQAGTAAMAAVVHDQVLWEQYLRDYPDQAFQTAEWGTRPIDELLPAELVRELDSSVTGTGEADRQR